MMNIVVEQLEKSYGSAKALNGVSLEIPAGDLFFLLGASGCGKSTLLRCIAGLETPERGRVMFGGRDVTALPPHRREAAMVFQSYALWPHMTVAQNIAFGLEERRIGKAEIRQRVDEVLQLVRLDGYGERSIDAMSGGQQQRVALARALVVRPQCLLLDEPLSNLDAQLRVEMRLEIRRMVKQYGLTAIYVTHDQEEALSMADGMAVLAQGRIAQVGSPAEVYRSPLSAEVAGFIGETNLWQAHCTGNAGEIRFPSGPCWRGRLVDPALFTAADTAVMISVRPETICIEPPHAPTRPAHNHIAAQVQERVYLGQRIQYWLETALGRIQAVELNPQQLLNPGDHVTLSIPVNDVVIMAAATTSHA